MIRLNPVFLWLKVCSLGILLGWALPTMAQQPVSEEFVKYSDTTWYDRGFDLFIGGGAFFGNSFNANYYNGSNLNENNLAYIFDNKYYNEELMLLINEAYPYIGISTPCMPADESNGPSNSYDWQTRYKVRTMISLGARYKFRQGFGLSLSYSFSRLTATSRCLLDVQDGLLGNERAKPEMLMVGKEDRSMIDLSASYLFSMVSRVVKPFIELGVQFNYAKVKSFDAMLLDQDRNTVGREFSLLNIYDSQGYYPGAQTQDIIWGGPGFGFSGAAGLKIVCSPSVSIDPTFYCSFSRSNIYQLRNTPVATFSNQENKFTLNYGVLVRIVMNDFFFSKR